MLPAKLNSMPAIVLENSGTEKRPVAKVGVGNEEDTLSPFLPVLALTVYIQAD